MRLELILEGPSAEAAMRQIMPKIVGGRASVRYINMPQQEPPSSRVAHSPAGL